MEVPVEIGHEMEGGPHVFQEAGPLGGQHVVGRQDVVYEDGGPAEEEEPHDQYQHVDHLLRYLTLLLTGIHWLLHWSAFRHLRQLNIFQTFITRVVSKTAKYMK